MKSHLYKFFHDTTNDRTENGSIYIPKDKNLWPKKWKEIERKTYDRSEGIPLINPATPSSLLALLQLRNSDIDTIVSGQPTCSEIGSMLAAEYDQKKSDDSKRTVPSAGGRFPLEVYVMLWGEVPGLKPGSYHYNVARHQLEDLYSPKLTSQDIKIISPLPWVANIHGVFILSAVFDRTIAKYGSRGYRYILLEAGHVGQNICLAAAESGLSVRPLAAIDECACERILSLDSEKEQIVYAIAF